MNHMLENKVEQLEREVSILRASLARSIQRVVCELCPAEAHLHDEHLPDGWSEAGGFIVCPRCASGRAAARLDIIYPRLKSA